jgi:hypothetical protein
MSQDNYRVALILEGEIPINAVVVADGAEGDEILAANPTWIEVTGLQPRPGLDAGWKYVNGQWMAPPIPAPTHQDVEAEREFAYRSTSDPVFFQYQRREATEQEWLDAVQAVKDAHPYPEA